MIELLTIHLLRQTLVVLILGSIALLLLRRFRSPRVHRVACLLVLAQGALLFHLSLPLPDVVLPAPNVGLVEDVPTSSDAAPVEPTIVETTIVEFDSTTTTAPEQKVAGTVQVPVAITSALHKHTGTILFVWIGGALLFFARGAFRYVRFHLSVPLTPTTNQDLLDEWIATCQAVGVKPVPLLVSEDVGPGVMVRPRGVAFVVPCGFLESLSKLQRQSALAHEAQHLKRADLVKSFVVRGLAALQWFNPIAWKLANRFTEAAEWACDERCRKLLPHGASEFARALLNQAAPMALLPQPAANMHGQNLATRIRRLLAPELRKESMMKRMCLLSAFLVLLCVSPFEPWSAAFAQSGEPEALAQTDDVPLIRVQMAEKELTGSEVIADAESRLVYEAVTPSQNYGEVDVKGSRYVRLPSKVTDVRLGFPRGFKIETVSPYMVKVTGQKPGLFAATVTDEHGEEWKLAFNVRELSGSAESNVLEAKLKQLRKLEAEIEKLRGPLLEWKTELYEVPVNVLKELAEPNAGAYGLANGSTSLVSFKLENGLRKKLKENKLAKCQSIPTVVSRANGKASILSGGETPIVVPAGDGKVAVEFRAFGLSLGTTARLQQDNSLEAQIRLEHSERDFGTAVTVDGITVPGFTVRRTKFQSRLKAGETLQLIGPTSDRAEPVPFENLLAEAASGLGLVDQEVEITKYALVVFLTPTFVDAPKPGKQKSVSPEPRPVSKNAATPANDVVPARAQPRYSVTPNPNATKWIEFGSGKE